MLSNRKTPISKVPPMTVGSMPNDGGHLLLGHLQRTVIFELEPDAREFLRPFVSARELVDGRRRWCLWLVDAGAGRLQRMRLVLERLGEVQRHRLRSSRRATQKSARAPYLFAEIRQPTTEYLLMPSVCRPSWQHLPIGVFQPDVIASNLVNIVAGATLFHFGVLTSQMHMAWVRQVCGRLKSDFRYSGQIVYNNFPWPADAPAARQERVAEAAQRVLDVRREYGDGRHGYLPVKKKGGAASLAALYDLRTMPTPLLKAHAALDKAVDRCYRAAAFQSDRERVEHLFTLYEQLTAPLLPAAPKGRKGPRSK
ncbi:MAG: type IIL restriction-modification enzyme MmeI [Pirellulaceae bacterium]